MSSISLKLGYKYLRSNKGGMFSFTTILAVIDLMIGISSLIVVTSVMNGFEKELENRILGVIPHSIIQSEYPIQNYNELILSIKNNLCPPTINLDNPDIGCDLNYSAHQASEKSVNYSLSNSFGFGGTNATLIFKELD